MSGATSVPLEAIMAPRLGSVDPSRHPDETFDLYSIPAFDSGHPEVLSGSAIGSAKQTVEPGDVLLSRIVPHIRRTWVVGDNRGRRLIASGEWIVFRSKQVDSRYLRHVLISDPFHAEFMRTVSGVGGSLLRARPAHVAKIRISLPPLPEQQRIAAILDKTDALRAKRRAALAQLDTLVQSIFLAMFGVPLASEGTWPSKPLGEACKKITDGTHHSPPIQPAGIPYITAKHLQDNGLDFFADPWFVSEDDHRAIFSRCDPRPGDVLYIKDGATTGIAAVNPYTFEFSMLSSVALLRPNATFLTPEFLCHWLNNALVKRWILGGMAGAAIRRLTLAKIKAIRIPLPPLQRQEEFARRVARAHQLRASNRNAYSELELLFASLQHLAFRGEL